MCLRKLIENDLPLILTWRNNPDVRRFMYNNHAITKDEHQEWFARMEQNPQSLWYIHEDQKGNPDGVVYFTQYQIEKKNAFWGFYAAPSASAGTGIRLGLDALNEAFDVLRLHKLNTEVLSTNERSLHFHNKLGFRSEGIFRDSHFDGENYINIIRYGILQSEWPEKRPDVEQRIAKLEGIANTISSGREG
jgi:UDP-4-amino-4,6-dideoxy-N-acetyl-beta-L-altrosamine N-acetyltransferase